MTLGERVAREKGIYPEAKGGWDISFRIFYSRQWLEGYLIANHLQLMIAYQALFWFTGMKGFKDLSTGKLMGGKWPGLIQIS